MDDEEQGSDSGKKRPSLDQLAVEGARRPQLLRVSERPGLSSEPAAEHPWPAVEGASLEAVRRSYEALLDAVEESVVVVDPEFRLQYANRAARAGWGPGDPVAEGLTCHELSHGSSSPCARDDCPVRITLAEGRAVSVRHVHDSASGGPQIVDLRAVPLFDAAGDVAMVLEVARDVTAMAQAEQQLRLFRQGVETSEDAIFLTNDEGHLVYVNPGFTKLYGWASEEAIGNTPRILKSGEYPPERYEGFWQMLLRNETVRGEMINRRRDGTLVTVDGSVNPILDDRGAKLGYLAIQRDVTEQESNRRERADLEEQLQQAQKLEALGRLAGGVAHDFNNLLTVITTYGELASESLPDGNAIREDLVEVLAAAGRAKDLTKQLLIFSRRQRNEPRAVSLTELVLGAQRMISRLIGEDIQVRVECAADLWPVWGDATLLQQILMNLAINSRDAMPEGGSLTIETRSVSNARRVRGAGLELPAGDHVMWTITDTGCGMDADTVRRIFEPFFTTKEPGKGTGLGLSMVYGTVQACGGAIVVKSVLGQGTSFEIHLPRSHAAHDEASVEQSSPPGHQETILIVEDEVQIRAVVRRVLEQKGYAVLEAADGLEALEVCRAHTGEIHLVVSDIIMPRLGGKALVGRIHALLPEVSVLLMSGYPDDAIDADWLRDEDVPFLAKPFSPAELAAAVRRALGG